MTDSNESASFRAPRLDFTGVHESNATNSNASGLSFIQGSSPPELYGSQSRNLQEDELPPPVLSAPPASIHSVVDRMAEEAQSQAALGERRLEEALQEAEQAEQLASAQTEDNANASIPSNLPNSPRRPQVAVLQAYPEGGDSLFQFGFSQVPALLQTNSLNVVGTSEQEASNTNVQFALNFSQVVDSQAMTQI